MEEHDRKEAFRYQFFPSIPVSFKIIEINGKRVDSSETIAQLIDISPNGMRIETLLIISLHYEIKIALSFVLNDIPLSCTGMLRWHEYMYYGTIRMKNN